MMNAADPDLKPFFSHGGKLLMYHGWADPGIPPMFSVEYYKSVVEKVGQKRRPTSIRLFMVPGMGHCAGGDGPSTFNAMAALSQWVEQGKAPDQMVASHSDARRGGSHPAFVPVSAERAVTKVPAARTTPRIFPAKYRYLKI